MRTPLVALLIAAAACGGAQSQVPPPVEPIQRPADEFVPSGYGRLNQDDLSLRLTAGDLEIRFLPLDERTLNLLSPDAARALRDLRESRRRGIDSLAVRSGSASPGVALVTFFASRDGVRFESEQVALELLGQQFRTVGTLPISANFSSQQLSTRGQASGLLVYDLPIPVLQEFVLTYQAWRTDGWKGRLSTINRERDRILTRIRATEQDTTRMP
jgi:hypothetical protein